jgi:hypothetical protein
LCSGVFGQQVALLCDMGAGKKHIHIKPNWAHMVSTWSRSNAVSCVVCDISAYLPSSTAIRSDIRPTKVSLCVSTSAWTSAYLSATALEIAAAFAHTPEYIFKVVQQLMRKLGDYRGYIDMNIPANLASPIP